MDDVMSLKEASEYLELSPKQIVFLIEAQELEGEQKESGWCVTRASAVAYQARVQAEANALQGIEEDRKPGREDPIRDVPDL